MMYPTMPKRQNRPRFQQFASEAPCKNQQANVDVMGLGECIIPSQSIRHSRDLTTAAKSDHQHIRHLLNNEKEASPQKPKDA